MQHIAALCFQRTCLARKQTIGQGQDIRAIVSRVHRPHSAPETLHDVNVDFEP